MKPRSSGSFDSASVTRYPIDLGSVAFRPTLTRGLALSAMFGFKLFLLYSKAILMPERIFAIKLLISKEDI